MVFNKSMTYRSELSQETERERERFTVHQQKNNNNKIKFLKKIMGHQ